jgi:hypothetical protein
MIELNSFDNSKLGPKLIDDISFVPVSMTEDHRVTQMHSIGHKVRDRKNVLDRGTGLAIHFLTKKNGRLIKVGDLPRKLREILENPTNGQSLQSRGMAAKDQIVSKKERVD